MAGAADHFVGAFHRLDRHDRLVLHRDRLADVERRDGVGHPVAELEILLLVLGRRPLWSARRPARAAAAAATVESISSMPLLVQHVGHRANQAVGVLRRQLLQDAENGEVRDDAAGRSWCA